MPNYTIKIHDLGTVKFSPHILLHKDKKYEIALIHGLIPKSWWNISSEIGNNTFTYNATPYVLEDGHYDLDSLLTEIQRVTNQPGINIDAIRHSGKVRVSNWTANDLVLQGLAPILGFSNPTTILNQTSVVSPNRADFSGGITELELHCDLVDRRYTRHQGRSSNILKSIIADAEPLSHIVASREIHYVPMTNADTLGSITLELKDDNNRIINLNGGSAEFLINIRPIENIDIYNIKR